MANNTKTKTDPATPKGYAEAGPASPQGYAEAGGQAHAPAVAVAEELKVRVRILDRCTAAGCMLAPGARINLPKGKAETLAAIGKAKIIGI